MKTEEEIKKEIENYQKAIDEAVKVGNHELISIYQSGVTALCWVIGIQPPPSRLTVEFWKEWLR